MPETLLNRQHEYFTSGATLPVKFRIAALKRLRSAIRTHERELLAALKSDLGKSETEAYMCEIGMTYAEIAYLLKHVKKFAKPEKARTPLSQFPAKSYKLRSPYGCALIMSPWNYPLLLSLEPLADAIAAGNCAIVKPSAYSPATGEAVRKLISETFLPEHVSVVTGGRRENDRLLDLPFDKIFFTGSIAVGKEVMRRAAEKLIPVTLELGGKSPCIVDETADLKLAAKRIVFGKFLNCGQTCVAPDYLLVHESVKETFLKELAIQTERQFGADPLTNPDYGKIVNEKHYARIRSLIDEKKIYFGGRCDDTALRIAPTILNGATREDACMKEEIFGPVLPVLTYRDRGALIEELNALPSPLALYLFSSDKKAIGDITARCSFGGGCINDTIIHLASPYLPFGGAGESGMGCYHGKDGFFCFTHEKSIVNKSVRIDLPMRYQPYTKKKENMIRKFLK
ncbi:MAG: aldehyde dehydrogenase [Clostridia bacterium]|nr:aldehyde dehydrogenase [Clostridia bacterium]